MGYAAYWAVCRSSNDGCGVLAGSAGAFLLIAAALAFGFFLGWLTDPTRKKNRWP